MKVIDCVSTSPSMADSTDSILTIEQVAQELKCSKSHVYNLNYAHKHPGSGEAGAADPV